MQPRTGITKPEVLVASSAWAWTLVVGVAFCALFYHFLRNQIEYSQDPDWSHAYLVPVISAFYIYENRRRILALPVRTNWLGIPLMLLGVCTYFFFTLLATSNHFVQGAAMILTLIGVVLLTMGWQRALALMFPMLYLAMGIRMPPRLLQMVTPTLQVWASKGSYYLLNILRFDTDISGTILTIYHKGKTIPLNVAEACSGMRMIVAFLALGIAIAFLTCSKWWQRIALVALGVPVAILVNVLRVASLGIASTINPELATGETHIYIGILWLIPAFLLYLGIVWVIQHLFVDSANIPEAKERVNKTVATTAPRSADRRWLLPSLVGVLAAGAIAFAPAQHLMGIYLRKDLVPLRRQLNELPMTVGRWKTFGTDEIVSEEVRREFGTDEYVTRNYAVGGDSSSGVLQLAVSYYTGGIDAVPHIPDRCYVGGGLNKSVTSDNMVLDLDESLWWADPAYDPNDPAAGSAPYMMAQSSGLSRQVVRMPRTGSEGFRLNSAEYSRPDTPEHTLAAGYLFIANGGATPSPEGVRFLAYDRTSRFAYFCKVQFTYQHPTRSIDRRELAEVASEFLNGMLPDLMSCLPDWWEVQHQQWPHRPSTDDGPTGPKPIGFRSPSPSNDASDKRTPASENG